LPLEVQRFEIGENLRWLSEIAGRPVRSFAYPFGGPVSAMTTGVLRDLGVETALTTVGSRVTAGADPLALPRFIVGDWPGSVFAKRVAEVLDG
jgi:hypothetical protein